MIFSTLARAVDDSVLQRQRHTPCCADALISIFVSANNGLLHLECASCCHSSNIVMILLFASCGSYDSASCNNFLDCVAREFTSKGVLSLPRGGHFLLDLREHTLSVSPTTAQAKGVSSANLCFILPMIGNAFWTLIWECPEQM